MARSIPVEFVETWGSIKACIVVDKDLCDGSRLTETMMLFDNGPFYCMTCYGHFNKRSRDLSVPKVNDAKFKCPEKNCDEKLYFHDFFARKCCNKSQAQDQRTEFQDLKKMMDLLEQSEREEKKAKGIMDSKAEVSDFATTDNDKKTAREESRSKFASSLTNAGVYVTEDKERTEKTKMQELREIMDKHDTAIKEEEDSQKKMEEDKKALDEATAEFMKKKEKREQVQSDLSTSFIDVGKELVLNGEVQENEIDKCSVCFEKYNKLDRHSCAPIQCGHLTCEKCLNELPEKICPICRKPFTENDIIKIYLK